MDSITDRRPVELVEQLGGVIERLQSASLWQCSNAELLDLLTGIEAQVRALQAVGLRLLAQADARGAATTVGATSAVAVLRASCNITAADAASRVRSAAALHGAVSASGAQLPAALPDAAAAFATGSIGAEHVRVIVEGVRRLPDRIESPARELAGCWLTEQARQFDPVVLRRLVARIADVLDPDGRPPAEELAARRWLSWRSDADGMQVGRLVLDPDAAAIVQTALASLAAPSSTAEVRDDRDGPQRHADALVELARRSLLTGGLPTNGGVRPQVVVTLDWDSLRDQLRTGGRYDDGERVAAESVRRIACDARVIPAVLGADGVPLDIGRARYTVPPLPRRALIVRDRGCAFPGCDRPAPWCEAHHIMHWADGGTTALDNLVLLCTRHHHTVHAQGWRIALARGRPEFTAPGDTTPRRNHLHHPDQIPLPQPA
ncbi:MAG: HNH endonuclease [Pseudonocardiales bacterium]|nr:MAG: HNH endonuclease [Pseudonocardiales bacterium]PZS29170.1 MAG: HNH endonuclease [Pseudonocardiales bacterium]